MHPDSDANLVAWQRARDDFARAHATKCDLHFFAASSAKPGGAGIPATVFIGCSVLGVRYWMLDVGCWVFDVGCWMFAVKKTEPRGVLAVQFRIWFSVIAGNVL
jgi:hypothetical protein